MDKAQIDHIMAVLYQSIENKIRELRVNIQTALAQQAKNAAANPQAIPQKKGGWPGLWPALKKLWMGSPQESRLSLEQYIERESQINAFVDLVMNEVDVWNNTGVNTPYVEPFPGYDKIINNFRDEIRQIVGNAFKRGLAGHEDSESTYGVSPAANVPGRPQVPIEDDKWVDELKRQQDAKAAQSEPENVPEKPAETPAPTPEPTADIPTKSNFPSSFRNWGSGKGMPLIKSKNRTAGPTPEPTPEPEPVKEKPKLRMPEPEPEPDKVDPLASHEPEGSDVDPTDYIDDDGNIRPDGIAAVKAYLKAKGLNADDPMDAKDIKNDLRGYGYQGNLKEFRKKPTNRLRRREEAPVAAQAPEPVAHNFDDDAMDKFLTPEHTHAKYREIIKEFTLEGQAAYFKALLSEGTLSDGVDRRKVDSLPIRERVNYYKNLI